MGARLLSLRIVQKRCPVESTRPPDIVAKPFSEKVYAVVQGVRAAIPLGDVESITGSPVVEHVGSHGIHLLCRWMEVIAAVRGERGRCAATERGRSR